MISGVGSLGSFTGFKAHEFVAHASKTNCVAIGPRSGQVLATGGDDKRVNVWRVGRASSIWSLTGNSSAIESLRFDPTEGFLVSGSAGGAVKLFDLSAGKMTRHFRGHMSNVTVIDCGSFDRRFVTTGSMDCQVKLWNVETKECAMAFKGHNAEVTDVQFSPDGYILASAAADGQVKLWDLRAGKPMHTFQACSGPVRAIRFNPQEFLLAAATSDRTVKLYDIEFMELFCTTAPDTCPIRAISFDPDGQNMYCASPSGLRRWSWDNDTASARLEAIGDVPWGKVCAGALHYNTDGRQLLAASCAGSRVSVWAVDFDEGAPLPSRTQQQEETGSAVESQAAEVVSQPAPTLTATSPSEVSGAASNPGTPAEKATRTAIPPVKTSMSPGASDSTDAKITSSTSAGKDQSEEQASREERSDDDRGSKRGTESKQRDEEPISGGNGGLPTFQVLGRQLPLLPTAAEDKGPSPRPKSSAAAGVRATNPPTAAGGLGPTSQAAPAVASLSTVVTSGGRGGGGGGAFRNRRSSRAEAVAAAVAAVASAKAATDDAVASVSSSGRHRSIGTSISDTLVITAHPGGGNCGVGAPESRPEDSVGNSRGSKQNRSVAAAWTEPAPGKEDGSSGVDRGRGVAAALGTIAAGDRPRLGDERHTAASNRDSEHKWHKRVTSAFAGVEQGADGAKAEDRRPDGGDGGGRYGDSGRRGLGAAEEKEAKLTERGEEKAPPGETAEFSGAARLFTVNPWSQDLRKGGAGGAREEARGRGEGGDSPPLLGSPEPMPAAAVAAAVVPAASAAAASVCAPTDAATSPPLRHGDNALFLPSTSRRSPDIFRQRESADAIVARSSTVGFPIAVGDADSSSSHNTVAPAPDDTPAEEINKRSEGDAAAADGISMADILSDGGGGGGGGELGMTRPRTATRRWDRPGPPGDDEVIAKTLRSRAAVTSTLSNRLTHLRMLRYGWADGDISGTISRLARLERSVTAADDSARAVVADFLWVVPLEGARVTLEHCLELMPLLEGFWKLDADSCVAAATRCLESIVRRFGGFVRDTLAAPVATGRVDLAREDRIARCREAHRAFIRGYHHLERSEGEFYEDRRIAAVAERLRPLFESYFMS